MLFFLLLLFSKRVQILKTEYKYGQYCTPLNQSDCRYFFVLAININKEKIQILKKADPVKNQKTFFLASLIRLFILTIFKYI